MPDGFENFKKLIGRLNLRLQEEYPPALRDVNASTQNSIAMHQPLPKNQWPASGRASYEFDLEEVFGSIKNRGYAYAYDERRRKTLALFDS